MTIYAIDIMPLIQQWERACPSTTQCWYADDDGAADDLLILRKYWDTLNEHGPGFGYFPNAIKTVLLAKQDYQQEAQHLFADTGITIRCDGCRYLGGAVGGDEFCQAFMTSLADKWSRDLRTRSEMTRTQPHAAYSDFTKGLSSRWKYHIRSTECSPETFATLDDLINTGLLPAFTSCEFANDQPERRLLSLPA